MPGCAVPGCAMPCQAERGGGSKAFPKPSLPAASPNILWFAAPRNPGTPLLNNFGVVFPFRHQDAGRWLERDWHHPGHLCAPCCPRRDAPTPRHAAPIPHKEPAGPLDAHVQPGIHRVRAWALRGIFFHLFSSYFIAKLEHKTHINKSNSEKWVAIKSTN